MGRKRRERAPHSNSIRFLCFKRGNEKEIFFFKFHHILTGRRTIYGIRCVCVQANQIKTGRNGVSCRRFHPPIPLHSHIQILYL